MNNDNLKNIKLNLDVNNLLKNSIFVNPAQHIHRETEQNHKKLMDIVNQTNKEKREYDAEVLKTLKNIEHGIIGLADVVSLLKENNDNQEKMIEYLKESLDIAASANPEEAQSKWRKLMSKASTVTDDFETLQKLQGFAQTIWTLFNNINS